MAREKQQMKRILVVAMDFPFPPDHGAAVDMWARILILTEMGYSVDLLATVREMPDEDRMQAMRERVGNLWVVRRRCGLRSALSFLPFQVRSRIDLQDVMLGQRYDAVILEADYVAAFLKNPAARQTKLILRIHNEQVGHFRILAEGSRNWLKKLYYYSESFKFRFFSSTVMRKCDCLWFISDRDQEEHIRKNPQDDRRSFHLPTHVNSSALRPYSASSRTALFLGGLTIPNNVESAVWYIEKVPSIVERP